MRFTDLFNQRLLYILLAVMCALQVAMVFRYNINVDEFFLLELIYQFHRGEFLLPLQTIYMHGFGWLPLVSTNEVTQIVAARIVMLGFTLATAFFLFGIVRRYYSKTAALFSVFAFFSFAYVFQNATAFRVDAIVTSVSMASLWVLTRPATSYRKYIFAGLLFGFACMLTIKAVFYTPIIAWALFARWAGDGWAMKHFWQGVIVAGAAVASFVSLYFIQSALLSGSVSTADYLRDMAGPGIFRESLFPTWDTLSLSLTVAPFYWGLFLLGGVLLLQDIWKAKPDERWNTALLLGFAAPVATLVFYAFSYNYFYTFMLAPASVYIAAAVSGKLFTERPTLLTLVIAGTTLTLAPVAFVSLSDDHDRQKRLVSAVHDIFPDTTSYIDGYSMISSYPKHGFFIVGVWGDLYLEAKDSVIRTAIKQEKPKFVLANTKLLDIQKFDNNKTEIGLLSEDQETLKENYIHHWGPVYVPGKRIDIPNAKSTITVDIIIDGLYTIESKLPIIVNGSEHGPGEIVSLGAGENVISSKAPQKVTFRWGQNLHKPDFKWVE